MDLQLFITINVVAISGLIVLLALVHRARDAGTWIGLNAAIVVVGLAALWLAPDWSGVIAAAAFVPLVLAPSLLSHLAHRRAGMGQAKAAARLARWAAYLHPTARSRFSADIAAALSHDDTAENVRAIEALAARSPPEQAALLSALAAAECGEWPDVLTLAGRTNRTSNTLNVLELRALGETGNIEAMTQRYEAAKTGLPGGELMLATLFLLAFAGRLKPVDALLDGPLSHLDADSKAYWRAVAAQASGEGNAGSQAELELARLASSATRDRVRAAAASRLSHMPPIGIVSQAADRTIEAAETRALNAAEAAKGRLARSPATLALIAANAAMFGLEAAYDGSEDLSVLVDLGAMWPPLVLEAGEWWRLGTAAFLHFGPVHLAANMFILMVLGRSVEPAYGTMRFVLIYLLGGIGSSAAVLTLMNAGVISEGVLVGASGAIFAIFGAEVARHLSTWSRSRDALDRRHLVSLALVLGVQVVIDLSVPEVSAAAHFSGFLIGLVMGLIIYPRRSNPQLP